MADDRPSSPSHGIDSAHDLQPSTIPLKLGDAVVGWATVDLVEALRRSEVPHLLIAPMPPEVLGLRSARRFLLVPQSAITYISSKGGLVTAFTDQGPLWTDLSMAQLGRRLDPRRFYRLDQSHFVNLTRIVELVPFTHQRYRLVFGDAAKSELIMSRDVGRRLRKALGW